MSVFFFNDPATTEIYTLSLHDALPICSSEGTSASVPAGSSAPSTRAGTVSSRRAACAAGRRRSVSATTARRNGSSSAARSEEHTSELQSRQYLVCRLLLEKKPHHRPLR